MILLHRKLQRFPFAPHEEAPRDGRGRWAWQGCGPCSEPLSSGQSCQVANHHLRFSGSVGTMQSDRPWAGCGNAIPRTHPYHLSAVSPNSRTMDVPGNPWAACWRGPSSVPSLPYFGTLLTVEVSCELTGPCPAWASLSHALEDVPLSGTSGCCGVHRRCFADLYHALVTTVPRSTLVPVT